MLRRNFLKTIGLSPVLGFLPIKLPKINTDNKKVERTHTTPTVMDDIKRLWALGFVDIVEKKK